ncbi:hypothetical protein BC939DRAFT_507677 [Gamsiella multidivaricata]|uniref:uncharacterized protein n=1 Tax=Gamsiella multidivaricata TaxID=101098 RepID=UPI0022205435|nr:uncharacterized protein BC939DRAFT_507677 [Gamsiella multidivaricata]KAG0360464.1 hypothetical protein BGZ54_009514 [Gamsiella multidivaricata]KAI7817116.1 hypothetical protein BC939DRAFT_507677 [Gamsiella multidivaricata]
MFKKRSQKDKKKNQDDNDQNDDDNAITISVPQDAFEPSSLSNNQPSARTSEDSSSIERRHVQPHQPWKPWDPQKLARRDNRPSPTSTSTAATTPVPPPASPSSTSSSSLNTPTATKTKSPSMALNLSNMFSSSGGTIDTASSQQQQKQQQPIEAQLWNADLTVTSPLSPAGPRYIPAIAGSGAAHPKAGAGSMSRLTSGWGIGFASDQKHQQHRHQNDGSTWRSFGQASAASSPAATEQSNFPRTPTSATFMNSQTLASYQGERVYSRSAMSFRSKDGYISNADGNSVQSSIIPAMSSPTLNIPNSINSRSDMDGLKSNEGLQKKIARGVDDGVQDTQWIHNKDTRDSLAYMNGSGYDHGYRDEELQGQKKDRLVRLGHRGQHNGSGSHYPLLFTDPKRVLRARLFCLRQNRRLHPCIRLVVVLFLIGSVCFTTFHLMFRESNSRDRLRKSFEYTEQQLRVRRILGQNGRQKRVVSAFDVEAQNYSIHQWALDTYDIDNSKAIARVSEDYMLSKAFSGAMYPTQVIPFYFRASFRDENDDDNLHEDDDDGLHGSQKQNSPRGGGGSNPEHPLTRLDPSMVTITTLITPDRYGVFLKLVKQYRGPISVATHIRKGEDQDAKFHELNEFFRGHSILRRYVDLHVIVDRVDLQLNMWRNVARMFARTDYFMMLDVDFHIPSGLKNRLHHDPRIQELLLSGAALVIPAFEYALKHDPKDSKYFPDTKADLIPLLEKQHIRVFHDSFPPGHAATDTPRWIEMSKRAAADIEDRRWASVPKGRAGFEEEYRQEEEEENLEARDEGAFVEDGVGRMTEEERGEYLEKEAGGERPYKVTKFEPKYEPYIVLKRESTPWCDERFVGYGANKAACLFEMYISGIDFWVMPQDFLIHQYHEYPTTNRRNGRILNKQLFVQFQQEVCFSTLQRMIVTGEWYTSKADNLRHQCKEFEDFLKSGDEMAEEYEARHPGSLLQEPVFVADRDPRRSRKGVLRVSAGLGEDGREGEVEGEGDRYESPSEGRYGWGKNVALGEQVVDDEEHQNPFMSQPKGRVWGGIQPRTFYVPPLPEVDPDDEMPIEGIDIDVAVGDEEKETERVVEEKNVGSGSKDLTGERLEQFRQGVILPVRADGHDRDRQLAFEGEGRKGGGGNSGERSMGEDANDQDQRDEYGDGKQHQQWKGENRGSLDRSVSSPGAEERMKAFEEAAGKLEEKFRMLGVSL